MQNITLEKIKQSIENQKSFFYILKNIEENKQDVEKTTEYLKYLKLQHENNKSLLEDLGIEFENTGFIKKLNTIIRDLEKRDHAAFSFENISAWIENIKNNIEDSFSSEYGLKTQIDINIKNFLQIDFKYIHIENKFRKSSFIYYKTDKELEDATFIQNQKNETGQSHWKIINKEDLSFCDFNKEKLEKIILKAFNLEPQYTNFKFKISNSSKKNEGDFSINTIEISSTMLASHKSFAQALKNHYGE